MRVLSLVVLAMMSADPPGEPPVVGLPLTGDSAVRFLRVAEVVGEPEDFDPLAITEPVRVTVTDGELTLRAIFKDEDTLHRRFGFADGREADRVRDSYRHEIAAYELDQMLGLGIVPPCVERTLFSRPGALCLWVEGAITEAERKERELAPPDRSRWTDRMILVRVFQQLIWDQDHANIRNILVDGEFRIYKVDSSMAFHADSHLRSVDRLTRFSRSFLEALDAIDLAALDERLGPWLTKGELKALWKRRLRLLELARKRVAEHGEAAILY